MTAPVHVTSFGYGHGPAPDAHLTIDVREHFRDPHVDPALRQLTADDPRVTAAVLGTPGIIELIEFLASTALAFLSGPRPGPVTIAIGCVGGRHRSAAVATWLTRELQSLNITVTLTHRDMHRPVIGHAALCEVTPC